MSRTRRHTGPNRPSYFGVVIDNGKNDANRGTVWRTAYNLHASFTGQIGGRYRRFASDTVAAYRHLPHHIYTDPEDWHTHIPHDCVPVAIELRPEAENLVDYKHPPRAVYVVGPEDGQIRSGVRDACRDVIEVPTRQCMNQAITVGVVLWDRYLKIHQ